MRRILFSIKDLKCSYDSGKIVLDIDRLDIYDGQITFIVGKSGSGKSTLLETLGFMNDTFSS
ncbi:MAG TPA: ATP-binding cassette domain-containing protein, partial [Saprospiraceae bacterium]|nr:ATP-binding cassette domain-containing protein [Saprospiraceae bacterium]